MELKSEKVLTCGYLGVSKPELTFHSYWSKEVPKIGDIYYAGLCRWKWLGVSDDYYAGVLPARLKELYKQVKDAWDDFTGVDVSQDLNVALELLAYSNRNGEFNELITLSSPTLLEIKGAIEVNANDVEWLGYDVVSIAHFSLILEGLFVKPTAFHRWVQMINKHGLLPEPDMADAFIEDYCKAAEAGLVEELIEEPYHAIEPVLIGRVKVGKAMAEGAERGSVL